MRHRNPYPRQDDFGLRFLRAKALLERFGRDCFKAPYSPSFDNCFEMFDGKAVVWALMDAALRNEANGEPHLAQGIRSMGPNVWAKWRAVYEAPAMDEATQLALALEEPHP